MTSIASTSRLPRPGVSLPRVIESEFIKLRTVRKHTLTLVAAMVLLASVGALIASLVAVPMADGDWEPGGDPFSPADPTAATLFGVAFIQLLVGALGVLFVTDEYSSGMINATVLAVPTRWPVLVAKCVVLFAVTYLLTLGGVLVAFLGASNVFGTAGLEYSLSDPDALRAVLAAPAYLAGVGLLGIGLGVLTRSVAGAVTALFMIMFLLFPLLHLLLPIEVGAVLAYLPSSAGQAAMTVTPRAETLAPAEGMAVFAGYVLAVLGTAAIVLKRRDI